MTAPVVLAGVSRRYGGTVALDDVDLTLEPGSLTGLLGPNGAGKSTLVNLVAGLRRADSGTVRLFGGDPRDAANRVALGTTPQQTGLPETLRVGEVVRFVSGHFPDPVPAGELLERFGLDGLERRQTGGLSGGQRRRLAVALAFCGRPRLVLLDEPTTGLDVEGRRALWDAVRDFHAGGGTVLLTTHYLDEIENLAERVVVLAGGRIRADGDVGTVRGAVRRSRVTLRAHLLPELPGVEHAEQDGDRWTLHTPDADELVRALVRDGVAFSDLGVQRASLEDAFLSLTGRSTTTEPATGGSR
ncbi:MULTISPECIES: ABC transporter ATP-binding protein [Pseudonocardia]|uniref:Daunorubicin/doxorubicin resistance ATP-binding protein DrrA n=2 Tax=Pseudonocardia TaxID=1847 RepID=A0A1Y2N5K2_PSEAH|nr:MULTISPECIES: ABC transporter ATP-binding protein [Pseudonocardia]OSY42198.1 Daunorubicin/doxorubicin resistance ATP-binding protein DrrA [Pseudonocardia autotrophica]TDN75036.1 ABC-2 type transport system ATP-binding protein [Pseudonocardia autotrophica]BBF98978.1 ABC transporter ATP-binding protein [Pseudonocardia autotrophica]GEC23898.1 ABC transporter ATP-binding protein [Pseudonocardia saturnea]